jgi:hypothetical protein
MITGADILRSRVPPLTGLIAVALAAPAGATAQEALPPCESPECCREAEGAELYGRVLTAEGGRPVAAATVEIRVTAPPEKGRPSVVGVQTDTAGAYRLCGLPTSARVEARASRSGATSRSVAFDLGGPDRLELSFEIRGLPAGLDSLERAAAASREASAPGRIVGWIRDAGTGEPVAEAALTLEPSGRRALTDGEGRFEIPEAPAGQGELTIHHIGYGDRTVDVDVPPELTVSLDIELPPTAVELEPIDVRVESTVRDPYLEDRGYYDRKRRGDRLGMGEFLDGRDIQIRGAQASHVLSTVPGLRTMGGQYNGFVHFNRYKESLHGGPCLPAIYLDGRKIVGSAVVGGSGGLMDFGDYQERLGGRRGLNTLVAPASLAAVEVYKGAASTAGEFQGSDSRCGVVALWTKHGPDPESRGRP